MREFSWKQSLVDGAMRTLKYLTVAACVFFVSAAAVAAVAITTFGEVAEPDTVLGVLDRVRVIEAAQHEHELQLLQTAKSQATVAMAEFGYEVELDYCRTTDWTRIDMETGDIRKGW